ncbi:MAG: lysostaphin resistance A-like protein [Bacteroidales bacterium]
MVKGVFENCSSMKKILILVVLMLVGLCIASVMTGLVMEYDFDQSTLLRIIQFLTLSGLFIFPAFFGADLFSSDWKAYLYLDKGVRMDQLLYTILLVISLQPFLSWMIYINSQIILPEFLSGLEELLRSMEKSAEDNIMMILKTDSIAVCLINILLISVLTAIGEEAFFRGVLQRIMLDQTKRVWVGILLIAIIFSAIHFQFYGFFARMLLGALFGYLVFASKALLLPIIAHAVNNLIAILQIYFDHIFQTNKLSDLPPRGIVVILSVFGSAFFLRLLIRSFRRERGIASDSII